MLLNPQILLLCGIYFSVQLSIYANTFWLPSIVKQIPGTTDLSVGFLSAIPWVCAVVAMYFAAKWQDRAKSKRPLLVVALLVAAVGTFAAAVATPVLALVFLAVAAMGFKSASPLFWTIPQSGLHPLVLAPAIAIINSLGNLGGFVAPFGFGLIKEQTGSVVPGLFALAAASTLAAGLVYFLKERTTTRHRLLLKPPQAPPQRKPWRLPQPARHRPLHGFSPPRGAIPRQRQGERTAQAGRSRVKAVKAKEPRS